MNHFKKYVSGIILSGGIAALAYLINLVLPADILGGTLVALILGMLLNPLVRRYDILDAGVNWTSKYVLRAGIILAGITLSFAQVSEVGKHALILMVFTMTTSFGVGYICHRIFKINWKLTSMLSASTTICGGTAVATLGPTIQVKNRDIVGAISATFIFDLITVISFPCMSDTGYGLLDWDSSK